MIAARYTSALRSKSLMKYEAPSACIEARDQSLTFHLAILNNLDLDATQLKWNCYIMADRS